MIEIFKALSDTNRMRIFNLLMKNELCVCEIETILDMTQSNVSRHLSKLKNASMICASKDAQWVHYRLNDNFVKNNSELISYLKNQFRSNDIYRQDLGLLYSYYQHGLSCQDIRSNKEAVLQTIKKEVEND